MYSSLIRVALAALVSFAIVPASAQADDVMVIDNEAQETVTMGQSGKAPPNANAAASNGTKTENGAGEVTDRPGNKR